jgi:hypothetical protein
MALFAYRNFHPDAEEWDVAGMCVFIYVYEMQFKHPYMYVKPTPTQPFPS